jgi:outer membrane translocation and assembly module TamA
MAAFTRYDARGGAPYDFSRLDLVATQHVPLYRENWVLAFRGLFSATSTSDGQDVPYFLLPMLGESSDEFRGYPTFRFRDRHRLLLTGEYRWMPSHYLDLALFVDAGNVAPEVGDLDLGSLKTAWGLSARLHTPVDTLLHASVGRGREGWRLIVGFGQVF